MSRVPLFDDSVLTAINTLILHFEATQQNTPETWWSLLEHQIKHLELLFAPPVDLDALRGRYIKIAALSILAAQAIDREQETNNG